MTRSRMCQKPSAVSTRTVSTRHLRFETIHSQAIARSKSRDKAEKHLHLIYRLEGSLDGPSSLKAALSKNADRMGIVRLRPLFPDQHLRLLPATAYIYKSC